eukprot:1158702-Pelagomonas_calceolata.AAC.11
MMQTNALKCAVTASLYRSALDLIEGSYRVGEKGIAALERGENRGFGEGIAGRYARLRVLKLWRGIAALEKKEIRCACLRAMTGQH